MISNRSGRIAVTTTAMLLGRVPNVSLEAVEGSPLDQLVDASDDGMVQPEGISLESIIDEARAVSMVQDLRDGSTHDLVMEESVDTVVGSIRNSVNFTRNVLTPAVNQLDSQVREALTNFSPIRFFIDSYFFKPIFASATLIESVDRFSNAPIDTDSLKRLLLPAQDDATLTEMLRTGMPDWDNLIVEFLAAKPEGWLSAVYNSLFGKGTDSLLIPDEQVGVTWTGGIDRKADIRPVIGTEDYLLAGYLLASAMIAKPNADANLSLGDWRSVLSVWVQQLGRGIIAVQRSLASRIRSGLMVLRYPVAKPIWKSSPDEARIVVLGNVYTNWLAQGGSPEVIIGAMFLPKELPYTTADLDAQKDNCLRAYGQYEQMLGFEVKSRAEETISNAFSTAAALAVVNASDADLRGRTKTEVQADVTAYLKRISDWGNVDIYRLARDVLGNVVYNCPLGMRVVQRIDEITEVSDRSPQEAAYIALEEIVSAFVAQQIKVAN